MGEKFLIVLAMVGFSPVVVANGDSGKKRSTYHCEKVVSGTIKDLPKVKTRKECKKNGGKWKKAHKDESHEHKSGDEHDHK